MLVHDDNSPPQRWITGRVTRAIAGEDGKVRVAVIKTAACDIPARRSTVGPSRPLRPALAADRRQGKQRPPPKKDPLSGRGELGGVDDPHRRTLCGSRTKWYMRYLQQGISQEDTLAKAKEPGPTTSGDRTPAKRSSRALTPPTDTPKRVLAAELTAQRPGAANSVRAEHRAPKEGRQEARDEGLSTSAAAAAEPTAREFTSSAPTEPRTSYAAVASKVKVAVLPVDYPQVILSPEELSALEEAILNQVNPWDTAVLFVGILVLGIDEMAKNNIVARGHQLFFRFGKIPFIGMKRVAKRDGMRAAPAPSGTTAPAREDLPLTGMKPEMSMAASGSSVCPAGHSDSLVDLAEDEGLADLTLDPAAV
ncbi:hypothetical protein ACLKA7_004948 [Drosophila subpalustris]